MWVWGCPGLFWVMGRALSLSPPTLCPKALTIFFLQEAGAPCSSSVSDDISDSEELLLDSLPSSSSEPSPGPSATFFLFFVFLFSPSSPLCSLKTGANVAQAQTGHPCLASQHSGGDLRSGGEGGESCASSGLLLYAPPMTVPRGLLEQPRRELTRGLQAPSSGGGSGARPFLSRGDLEPHQAPGWPPPHLSLLLPFSSSSCSSLSDSLLDSPEPLSLLLLLSDSLSDSGSVEEPSSLLFQCTGLPGPRAGALGAQATNLPLKLPWAQMPTGPSGTQVDRYGQRPAIPQVHLHIYRYARAGAHTPGHTTSSVTPILPISSPLSADSVGPDSPSESE